MNEIEIFKYDPVIYPVKLHVAFSPNLKFAWEGYRRGDGTCLKGEWEERVKAYTFSNVKEVETGKHVVLVVFRSKKAATIPTIAHEAKHVADFIFEDIGMTFLTCEPHAYLLEWAVKCMLDALKRRPKETDNKDKPLSDARMGN